MVPVRGVFEALGFSVVWDENTSTAILTGPNHIVEIHQGERYITINGSRVEGDVPPQLINGRFMLPLHLIAEATDSIVDWDNGVVSISSVSDVIQVTEEGPFYFFNSGDYEQL